MTRWIRLSAPLLLWAVGCSSSGSDAGTGGAGTTGAAGAGGASGGAAGQGVPELTIERAIAEYRTWAQRTDAPVAISGYIFSLCRLPTLPEQQFAESEHGRGRYLLDWLTPGAVTGFASRGAAPFPVGAAIVKEKLLYVSNVLTPVALGVMIKRAPGFDAANADWEFGYWEESLGVLRGPDEAEYCGGCHARARATDLVYFDQSWALQ